MNRSKLAGSWGEGLAAEYLRSKKYSILAMNFTTRFGEIDIISRSGKYIVFVEVKLRKNADFAMAREFVDYRKQNRIRSTAQLYLSWHPNNLQPRFDVIEIYAPEGIDTKNPVINHLEDAFQ